MENVKQQIKSIIQVMKYNKEREKRGLPNGEYHNVYMFVGAPGTAKTTVARMLGDMMVKELLLPRSNFISVNGAELKGKYVGHSAPKTKNLFDSYSPEEMVQIVYHRAKNMEFEISHEANHVILEYFKKRVDCEDFGNGREARSFLEECQKCAACRVMSLPARTISKKMLKPILLEDVAEAVRYVQESNEVQEGRKKKLGFCHS